MGLRQKASKAMKTTRPQTIRDIMSEGTLIDEAMAKAAREAWALHKRAGVPVPIWRAGKIVWIKPEDIQLPNEDELSRSRELESTE